MSESPLRIQRLKLHLKQTFRLSKGSAVEKETLVVRYENGIGEGSPSIFYGLPVVELEKGLRHSCNQEEPFASLESLRMFLDNLPRNMNPGKCAVEMAYLDQAAKSQGKALYEYLDLKRPMEVRSSLTISKGTEKEIRNQLESATPFRTLKLKVGFPGDLQFIDDILKTEQTVLRLDANGGWSSREAVERLRSLAGYPIEFVEQPITDPELRDLARIKDQTDFPLFVDESIISQEDLEKFTPVIDGVNLKLSKCGGLVATTDIAKRARELGLKLLLGCMIETAVGITAGLHIASLFDFFDLDSIMLTEGDPFWGAHFDGDKLILPKGSGIGITRGENVFA